VAVEAVAVAAVAAVAAVVAAAAVLPVAAILPVPAVARRAADAAGVSLRPMVRVAGGGEPRQGNGHEGKERRRCHERGKPDRAGHVAEAS
jgi:hypothetical protein